MENDSSYIDEDERIFDLYLEAAHAGAVDLTHFLAGHPRASSELEDKLRVLHAQWQAAKGREEADMQVGDKSLPWAELGGVQLLHRLGQGGMGSVYLGRQRSLGRLVAIKTIVPELQTRGDAQARFEQEAQAAAGLRHPNIVQIIDYGQAQDTQFIVMEWVPGESLEACMDQIPRPDPAQRVLGWAAQVARALEHAHRRGVIHRDVKPSNIQISSQNQAILLDFGLARQGMRAVDSQRDGFLGTLGYASPEQVRGQADWSRPATDVYALGVCIHRALTGVLPYVGGDAGEQAESMLLGRCQVSEELLSLAVVRLLERALARDPQQRFASAGAMATAIEAAMVAGRRPRRPGWRVGLAGGMASLAIVGGVVRSMATDGEERSLANEASLVQLSHEHALRERLKHPNERGRVALLHELLEAAAARGHAVLLEQTDLQGMQLRGLELSGAKLGRANLGRVDLRGAQLRGADLRGANLAQADLRGADLREAVLAGAQTGGAHFAEADLRGAQLAKTQLGQGKGNVDRIRLAGADLHWARIGGASQGPMVDWRGVDLTGANLRFARLEQVELLGATLTGASLVSTHFSGVTYNSRALEGYPPTRWPAGFVPGPGLIDRSQHSAGDGGPGAGPVANPLPVDTSAQNPCAQTRACLVFGRCAAQGDTCIAVSDNDCQSSDACRQRGLCTRVGGACELRSNADCRRHIYCAKRGRCEYRDGRCVIGSDADCAASDRCRNAGRCRRGPRGTTCIE